MLYRYNDGSVLTVMTARELINIPIWKGQRILDKAHSDSIKSAVGSNIQSLDSGYTIVKYKEESADGTVLVSLYLIDGQHRASVIRDYYRDTICEPDFNVTVIEKEVETESDAIEYFNKINHVKVQQWKMEPNIIINRYIKALEKVFNTNKKHLLIRTTNRRPYLCSENLRIAFQNNITKLKINKQEITKFVEKVVDYNKKLVIKFSTDLTQIGEKDINHKQNAINNNFALAYDTKLKWVSELLSAI